MTLDLGCSLTAAQAAYVAEQVADLASHHSGIVFLSSGATAIEALWGATSGMATSG